MSKLPTMLAALLLTAGSAQAGSRRVAVAPFGGPELVASEVHAVVVELVGDRYELVPAAELEQARAVAESDGSEPDAALTVARLTGADAAIVGRVAPSGEAYSLSLSVLRARTGETAGAVLVPLGATGVTEASRDRIGALLGDLLAWIDPQGSPPGEALAREKPAAAAPSAPAARTEAKVAKKAAPPRKPPLPIAFQAAVGLSAMARRFGVSQEPGLAVDPSLDSNPSPGIRLEAEAATIGEPGVALVVAIDRSIGAKASMGGVELPITQMQWSGALRGRMRVRKRWVPMVSLGYSELSHEVGLGTPGLLVPNARYAFLDIGGGTRYEIGSVALFGLARYLHTLATSGVTDPQAFGAASSKGLAAEGGVEVEVAEAILVRAGFRYLRFSLDFDGSGDLAVALDQDPEQDVIGAVDAFVGGYGEVVYRF